MLFRFCLDTKNCFIEKIFQLSADVHHTEGREKEQQDSQQLQDIASLMSAQAAADDGFGGFKAIVNRKTGEHR